MRRHLPLALLCFWTVSFSGLYPAGSNTVEAADPSDKWEPNIRLFEELDKTSPPPQNGVLFVGSSSIVKWDLKKSFPNEDYINRGFGGSEISDSIAFIDRIVIKHHPRVVIMYAGDNDIAKGKSAETVSADFATFQKKLHAALPEARLMYIAIKPSLKRWELYPKMAQANQLIAEQCAQNDQLTYLDIATPMLGEDGTPMPKLFVADGLHLSDAGYKLWTPIIAKHLEKASRKAVPE